MANLTWTGASSGSFITAANWSPAQAPASSDNLFFTSGAVDVDADLSQASIDCSIYIGAGYTGQIGNSAGDALDLGTITLLQIENGSNERFITGTTITKMVLANIRGLSDFGSIGGGNLTNVFIRNCSGGLNVAASTTLNGTIVMTGSDGFTLTIPSGITVTSVNYVQSSGLITNASGVGGSGTILLTGGRHVMTSAANIDGTADVVGYGRRAVLEHEASGDIDARVRVLGPQAMFDGRNNTNVIGTVDINADMEVGDGGRLLLATALDTYNNNSGNIINVGGGITDFEVAEEFSKS